jgi:hypothetical protein
LKLLDAAAPLLGEDALGCRPVLPPQRLDDLLVGERREGDPGGVPEISREVPAKEAAQAGDLVEKAAVGASIEEDAVPFVLEVGAAPDVATRVFQLAVEPLQTVESCRREVRRQLEGERLESAKNLAGLSDLVGVQRGDAEAASYVRLEDTFASQAEQGFANRGSADAESPGEVGIAEPASGRWIPQVDRLEDLAVDLVAEGLSGDHGDHGLGLRGGEPRG